MLRSLIWKEWREQRPVAVVGVILAVGMPAFLAAGLTLGGHTARLGELASLLPIANWTLLWPVAVVATAATMLSSDRDGRLAFLLSRPVPRWVILTTKMVVALAVAAGIVAVGQIVSRTVGATLADAFPVGEDAAENLQGLSAFDPLLTRGVLALAALAFALSASVALVVRRGLAIAGLGALGGLALFGANGWLWFHADYLPVLGPHTTLPPLLLTAGLLAITFLVYQRGELLDGRRHMLRVVALQACLLLLWAAGLGTAAAYEMRPPERDLLVNGIATNADASLTALTMARPDRAASRTVAILRDDGSVRPIGSRLSMAPAVSPNGRWVAYIGVAGPIGLRSSARSLWLWDRETEDTRLLARTPGDDWPTAPVFAPDSETVAARLGGRIAIADTVERTEPVPPRVLDRARCYIEGHDATNGQLLRLCRGAGRSQTLDWIDPTDGTIVKSLQFDDVSVHAATRRRNDRSSVVAVHLTDSQYPSRNGTHRLRLLDGGRELPLLGGAEVDWRADVFGFHFLFGDEGDSPERVAYFARQRISDEPPYQYRLQVRLLDLGSGRDRLIDEPTGRYPSAVFAVSADHRDLAVLLLPASPDDGGLRVEHRLYDLASGEPRANRTIAARVPYYRWRLGGNRLLYHDEPAWSPGDVGSLAQMYLTGWYRSARFLDLMTGVDRSLAHGASTTLTTR